MSVKKVVLAYSGGLDTSVAVKWMMERYDCEVIAYIADVGQAEDLEAAADKAKKVGVETIVVDDLKKTFVEDFVFPAFRAGAVYEEEYMLGTALSRPCITEGLMNTVREHGADAIAHGATGKGNDQVRFELAAYHFEPQIKVIAPWRIWDFKGRKELIDYTKEHDIAIEATLEKPYSLDRNILHTSFEGGILEDPWEEPKADMYQLTVDPLDAPDEPRYVEIELEHGNPVAVDGERLDPVELLAKLNEIAGANAVGRIDVVENRFVGMKSRGVYETPGGTLLYWARRAVESLTIDREVVRLRNDLIPRYASLIYNGFWFSPEREALQDLMDDITRPVTGTARLKLYKGSVSMAGRKALRSLYRPDIATFEADDVYDQRDAEGFIRLNALRMRIRSEVDRQTPVKKQKASGGEVG